MKLSIVMATILTSLIVGETDSYGQAYCALRDPTKRIYEFYPEASSFKSLVRTVDEGVRRYVASELPFTIHFNELGRHTLYVPVENDKPLGLVHARSEAGKFGLTEIVWSMTPSLVVKDYEFQRCRSRKRSIIESAEFKTQIIGKDFQQLRQLLSDDGKSLRPGGLKVKEDSAELAATVIRSALKTMAVSRAAWKKDLAVLQPLYHIDRAFPDAKGARRVGKPYNEKIIEAFDKNYVTTSGKSGSGVQRETVMLLQAIDGKNSVVGHVAKTQWKSMDTELVLWWSVRDDMVIDSVVAEGGWPDEQTKKAFEAVVGLAADDAHECSTAAEMVGAEVLMLSRHN